ncbi:MAG: alpha/beta hydrolase [Candidatus Nanopelagicales bacterium]|nr:alpha/beta hydrolase [Candidatus Nanopelagicales bacterium]
MLGSEKKSAAVDACAAIAEVSTVVEEIHKIMIGRTYRAIGLGGALPERGHRARVSGIYKALRAAVKVAGFVTGTTLEATSSPDSKPLADTPRGAAFVAGLTCAFGDSLRGVGSALATEMSVRIAGRAIAADTASLRRAYPVARPRIVVFLHGFGGTEFNWGRQFSYADHLRRDLDISPVQIRYNSGVRVCDSGLDLDRLLDVLVREWPVEVESIDIVAHSFGGLVARSACAIAERRGACEGQSRWLRLLDNVCYLAVPNHGVPTERVAATAISTLGASRVGAPIARLANRRSAAIKDLRHGSISEADTAHGDANRRELLDHQHLPLADNVRHHFVCATALPPHFGKLSHAVGDYLVQPTSALASRASGAREPFTPTSVHPLTGKHHNNLLQDDDVFQILRDTLAR